MTAQDLPDQLRLIRDNLGEGEIEVHPFGADDDFDFLYRPNRVLTRDRDVTAVRSALAEVLGIDSESDSIVVENDAPVDYDDEDDDEDGNQDGDTDRAGAAGTRRPTVPPGLTRLRWDVDADGRRAPEIIEQLDGRLEPGTATLEHYLYVCGHCCAGTEPLPPAAGTPVPHPVPGSVDCGDGAGVTVRVYDTGLAPAPPVPHSWMHGVTGDPDRSVVQEHGRTVIKADGGHGSFVAGGIRLEAAAATVAVTDMATRTPDGAFTIGVAAEADLAARLVSDDPDADIVVFSFAGETRNDNAMIAFEVAWESDLRKRKNLKIVAPAGNDSDRRKYWPAAFDWVVGVGALAEDQKSLAGFSNFGDWVDVFAPGENAVNAFATGEYTYRWSSSGPAHPQKSTETFKGTAIWSGTSFAAPMVAGMIAARMSARGLSSQESWAQLSELARAQRIKEIGPVLRPGQGCDDVRDRC